MGQPYEVHHLELDGVLIDRERGYPGVHLELRPLGTELAPRDQRVELVLHFKGNSHDYDGCTTHLSQESIQALYLFIRAFGKVEE